MSLDTILQIGKILRNSENNLKYFKYVEPCPKDIKTGDWPICITIPVNPNFTFQWLGMKITPENERERLFYLKYTTSDNDSSPKKYLFGDICYTRKSEVDKTGKIKGVKDFGNFTFEKGQGNAFVNGLKTYEEIIENYYKGALVPFINEIKNGINQETVVKTIINGCKCEQKIEIPKKLSEYSLIIEAIIRRLKENEKIELIQFHNAFKKEIEKFNNLLLYAPAFEHIIMNEKEELGTSLINIEVLQEKYLKVIKEKNPATLKRFLEKDETLDLLSQETRNKMLQFADFTIFIHFEYENNKNWFQFPKTFSLLKDKLNLEITNITEKGLVPSKSIYRTLCSGNDKNDIQFPVFNLEKSYRSFSFKDNEQFEDFLYTGSILNKPLRRLFNTDIDMFVFPIVFNGENISASDYDTFFFDKRDESRITQEPLFFIFQNIGTERFTRFDFIFADASGNTTNDLIEISGIEKSTLRYTKERIEAISFELNQERKQAFGYVNEFNNLKIEVSFRNILGSVSIDANGKLVFKTSAKYESHLLKVLPLIYTGNFFQDDLLLISFIQVSEYFARNIEKNNIWYNYLDLRYHLKFLFKIQNSKNDRFMEITSSESYQIGFMLGGLAKNLSQEINSFEKNYVGNLTRRIGNIADFIKLKNEIEQKLIMHDKTKFTFQTSFDLAQKVKEFKSRYDKEECAFGFMESYFKPIPKTANKTSENEK